MYFRNCLSEISFFVPAEKEERKTERTEKKEILWQPEMDGKTESIWLPPNPANVSYLQLNYILKLL